MYTALDHGSILASLNYWLLNLHFRRRGGVAIPKDPDQKPYFNNCITETWIWLFSLETANSKYHYF
jgi:hypothetical protein